MPALTISVKGVAHLLQNIDPKKTGDQDGIQGRFLRELSFSSANFDLQSFRALYQMTG